MVVPSSSPAKLTIGLSGPRPTKPPLALPSSTGTPAYLGHEPQHHLPAPVAHPPPRVHENPNPSLFPGQGGS